jgi:hypothetical protein
MTNVGPFSGLEDSFLGDNKGSISIMGGVEKMKREKIQSESSAALLVFV